VNELWLEVAKKDYTMVKRTTHILYNGKFFSYPLKPMNVFKNLGLLTTIECVFSYLRQKLIPIAPKDDFETWVTNRFGKKLYQIFFKTYSEKLWGIPCNNLASDFAAQRIKKLSLFEAVKNALSISTNHKTLIDAFAYPLTGTGMIYERMADFIKNNGGSIYYNCKVNKVITQDNFITGLQLDNGNKKEYDYVVSTMPITNLTRGIDCVPTEVVNLTEELKFRNTIIVYLKINKQHLFADNWLYVHSNDIKTGRITNFRNWSKQLYNQHPFTILALEYWCNKEDALWIMEDKQLIEQAKNDLVQSRLCSIEEIIDGSVFRIPKCYPVYEKNYKQFLAPIQNYLDSFSNLYAIGRYGAFKYNNQDHSIKMGIQTARSIVSGKRQNLWDINTDYDTFQEGYLLTEIGLVKSAKL
jgi:protoporphyrinogen oxidase